MEPDQGEKCQGQSHNVQREKAPKGSFIDGRPATHECDQMITNNWYGAGSIGSYSCCPERQLTPGQQITGQTEYQSQVEQNKTRDPGQLPRALVTPHEKNREHVRQHKNNNQIGADHMQITDQPAIGDIVHDHGDAGKGLFCIGHIINQQQGSGEKLQTKHGQQYRPQGVPDIDIARQQITTKVLV